MKKHVVFDPKASKEIKQFSKTVRNKFTALIIVLERDGNLEEPVAKKINKQLFELRVKYQGQYRALYCYHLSNHIIILSAFHKKSQKTPHQEIDKAMKRLTKYQYSLNDEK